jgi:hypothetical protein
MFEEINKSKVDIKNMSNFELKFILIESSLVCDKMGSGAFIDSEIQGAQHSSSSKNCKFHTF